MTAPTPKKAAPGRRTATKPAAVDTDTATPDPAPEIDAQRPIWEPGENRQDFWARLHAWMVNKRESTP